MSFNTNIQGYKLVLTCEDNNVLITATNLSTKDVYEESYSLTYLPAQLGSYDKLCNFFTNNKNDVVVGYSYNGVRIGDILVINFQNEFKLPLTRISTVITKRIDALEERIKSLEEKIKWM